MQTFHTSSTRILPPGGDCLNSQDGQCRRAAFTLIELLVVIAIIAILAGILLPVLLRAKQKAHAIVCVNNEKQLTMAWIMYANDFQGNLPPNQNGGGADTQPSWVQGWLDWNAWTADNYDITKLTQALLGPYCNRSSGIYKCPADKMMPIGSTRPRVRSISMNGYIEGGAYLNSSYGKLAPSRSLWYGGMYRAYNKQADLVNPAPSDLFVFVDEHPDSINDGWMITDETDATHFEDMPASFHDNACGFGFADGHAAIHRWLSAGTLQPVRRIPNNNWPAGTDQRDTHWMQQHATVPWNALP